MERYCLPYLEHHNIGFGLPPHEKTKKVVAIKKAYYPSSISFQDKSVFGWNMFFCSCNSGKITVSFYTDESYWFEVLSKFTK